MSEQAEARGRAAKRRAATGAAHTPSGARLPRSPHASLAAVGTGPTLPEEEKRPARLPAPPPSLRVLPFCPQATPCVRPSCCWRARCRPWSSA